MNSARAPFLNRVWAMVWLADCAATLRLSASSFVTGTTVAYAAQHAKWRVRQSHLAYPNDIPATLGDSNPRALDACQLERVRARVQRDDDKW